jgi:hypothetical protein
MKHRKLLALLATVLMILPLCGCGAETAQASPTPEPTAAETTKVTVSTMEKMTLSSYEDFLLNGLSQGTNYVYEVKLAKAYSKFDVRLYRYEDGSWRQCNSFSDELDTDSCYFEFSDRLDEFSVALKYKEHRKCLNSRKNESQQFENYIFNMDMAYTLVITGEEMPLAAYRCNYTGEERKACLNDFNAPEAVESLDGEEYYIMTVQFSD